MTPAGRAKHPGAHPYQPSGYVGVQEHDKQGVVTLSARSPEPYQAPPSDPSPTAPATYQGYEPTLPPSAGAWGRPYAVWGQRFLATLVDGLYLLPGIAALIVGTILIGANSPTTTRAGVDANPGNSGLVTFGVVLTIIGWLGYAATLVYNLFIVQGRTGASWGKRHLGLRVIHERTGVPLNIGMNFVRQLCHYYIDGIFYIGYVWPLWDRKRQTFADKIMTTVVVVER